MSPTQFDEALESIAATIRSLNVALLDMDGDLNSLKSRSQRIDVELLDTRRSLCARGLWFRKQAVVAH